MKSLVTVLALASLTVFAAAETGVVFESSFESPIATQIRTPKSKGGSIAEEGPKAQWLQFEDQPVAIPDAQAVASGTVPAASGTTAITTGTSGGGIVAGITTEMARSGEQCLYLEAKDLSVPYAGVAFSSVPIKIVPGKDYAVGIWGRNDPKTPLKAGAPQLFLKMQVDFFSDAGVTQTGDSEYLLQALPGSPGYAPTFLGNAWRQLKKRVVAPADANYMVVTYRCDCSPDQGLVNGVMFFDDVTVEGELPGTGGGEAAPVKQSATVAAPEPITPNAGTAVSETKPDAEAKPATEEKPAATATPAPTQTPKARSKKRRAARN